MGKTGANPSRHTTRQLSIIIPLQNAQHIIRVKEVQLPIRLMVTNYTYIQYKQQDILGKILVILGIVQLFSRIYRLNALIKRV